MVEVNEGWWFVVRENRDLLFVDDREMRVVERLKYKDKFNVGTARTD